MDQQQTLQQTPRLWSFKKYWMGTGRRGNLLLALPFLALNLTLLFHHELWRDEVHSWALACASPTLSNLLTRIHYEVHPALYYVVLYLASRLSAAVWMLKLVHALISIGIYLLLALTTPLRRFELAMLYGGYYFAIQYTVFCRAYNLAALLLLVCLWFRMRHPEWILRNALLLGLLANVDLSVMTLSGALLCDYLYELWRTRRGEGLPAAKPILSALAIYALLTAVALITLLPASDISLSTMGSLNRLVNPLHLGEAIAFWTGLPWYPQAISQVSWWADLWPSGFLTPLILLLYILVFRRNGAMARPFFLTILFGVLFSHVTGAAAVRHIGMTYLAFVAALSLQRFRGGAVSRWAYALLGLTVLASLHTLAMQWGRPFSDSGATARWIAAQELDGLTLIGTPDTTAFSVTERLNRPLYQLDCDCFDHVLTFSNRRDAYQRMLSRDPGFLLRETVQRTARGLDSIHSSDALLILNFPLEPAQMEEWSRYGYKAAPAAAFTEGYLPDEHYFLYRIRRAQTTPPKP